ncbi:MAG: polysaccharide pyruvyl transferase family protein [Lachnospiraceae bacterium]|nr:polysaccharide pyruvyl transferase family protein [Lachnospiraceae bacterium]
MINKFAKKIYMYLYLEYRWLFHFRKYASAASRDDVIFILNTPEHGNLGDHALALAEYNMFAEILPEHKIVEIPNFFIKNYSDKRLKSIVKDNTVFLHAGGYLGTIWMNEERAVRKILSIFRSNRIIILPQTITYSNDANGQQEKNVSKEYYSKCDDIYIFLRDQRSLNDATCFVGAKRAIYAPDMAIGYLPYTSKISSRDSHCLLCMRSDVEKSVDKDTMLSIKAKIEAKSKDIKIQETDTVVNYNIKKKRREEEVLLKLDEFASAKFVVTDRLHGMIFAAITATPCVVLNNANGKVKAVYEWIKELPFIRFIGSIDEFDTALDAVLSCENTSYPLDKMKRKYENMRLILKENTHITN